MPVRRARRSRGRPRGLPAGSLAAAVIVTLARHDSDADFDWIQDEVIQLFAHGHEWVRTSRRRSIKDVLDRLILEGLVYRGVPEAGRYCLQSSKRRQDMDQFAKVFRYLDEKIEDDRYRDAWLDEFMNSSYAKWHIHGINWCGLQLMIHRFVRLLHNRAREVAPAQNDLGEFFPLKSESAPDGPLSATPGRRKRSIRWMADESVADCLFSNSNPMYLGDLLRSSPSALRFMLDPPGPLANRRAPHLVYTGLLHYAHEVAHPSTSAESVVDARVGSSPLTRFLEAMVVVDFLSDRLRRGGYSAGRVFNLFNPSPAIPPNPFRASR